MDLRRRVVEAYEAGEGSYRELGDRFGVDKYTVHRWVVQWRSTGDLAPKAYRHGPAGKLDESAQRVLRELVTARPDTLISELIEQLASRTGIHISQPTMSRALASLGLRRKKSRSMPASKSVPTSWRPVQRSSPSKRASIRRS
jgi:transposase